jgi:hypothetical protein
MEKLYESDFFLASDIKTEKHRRDTEINNNYEYSIIVDSLD